MIFILVAEGCISSVEKWLCCGCLSPVSWKFTEEVFAVDKEKCGRAQEGMPGGPRGVCQAEDGHSGLRALKSLDLPGK